MSYSEEERLDIGRRIYNNEISRKQAAEEFGVSEQSARNYMRMYRDLNHLPGKRSGRPRKCAFKQTDVPPCLEDYESMTKEELIGELMKARIAEARLKKGYEVKGDGSVILYGKTNTR